MDLTTLSVYVGQGVLAQAESGSSSKIKSPDFDALCLFISDHPLAEIPKPDKAAVRQQFTELYSKCQTVTDLKNTVIDINQKLLVRVLGALEETEQAEQSKSRTAESFLFSRLVERVTEDDENEDGEDGEDGEDDEADEAEEEDDDDEEDEAESDASVESAKPEDKSQVSVEKSEDEVEAAVDAKAEAEEDNEENNDEDEEEDEEEENDEDDNEEEPDAAETKAEDEPAEEPVAQEAEPEVEAEAEPGSEMDVDEPEQPEDGIIPDSEEPAENDALSSDVDVRASKTPDTDGDDRRENPKALKRFQVRALALIGDILSWRSSSFFAQPVAEEEYYDVVKAPTDLKTIRNQIKEGVITSAVALEEQVQRMFANSIMYNPWDSDISTWTREMQADAGMRLQLFREFDHERQPTNSPTPEGPPSKRARRGE